MSKRKGKKTASAQAQGRLTRLLPNVVCLFVVAIAVAFVYRGVVHYFFSQDDFVSIWMSGGKPLTFWRILSSFLYFRLTHLFFGLSPAPYHVASLVLHAVNASLVFFIARSFSVDRASSLLASVFFAVHPALYVSLYSISSTGEILSSLFILLATLYLLRSARPGGALGIIVVCVLFAASILSKETTILFPLLVPVIYLLRKSSWRSSIPTVVALAAIAGTYGILFYATNVFGIREASSPTRAYAISLGPGLVTSLQTYFKWAFNVVESWYYDPVNLLEKNALPWLFGGIAFFALVCVLGANRREGRFCALWFFLMLALVLPLVHHPYHYYLYLPLAGFSPILGILMAAGLRKSRWKVLASTCVIAFLFLNSGALMSKMERAPFGNSQMRADPVFDRAIVSKNLINDIGMRRVPPGAKLLLVSPLKEIQQGKLFEQPDLLRGGSYWDENVRSAVANGLGIRLFFPSVDTVVFAREVTPGFEDYFLLPYTWNGHLRDIQAARYWTEVGIEWAGENISFALKCFHNAISLDSTYEDGYYNLARVYFLEQQLAPAATALRKYIALCPAGASRDQAEQELLTLASQGY